MILNKSIIILLLVCLLMPFTGSYLFLHFKKNKIRKEVAFQLEKGLHEKDLVILKFTKAETETRINWKHSREFEYDGQMYDIVDQSQQGDSIFYTCYKDHKETRLNAEKERIMAKALGQDPVQKKQNERIKNFFNSLYVQNVSSWNKLFTIPSLLHYTLNIKHYALIKIAPPSPPPKITRAIA